MKYALYRDFIIEKKDILGDYRMIKYVEFKITCFSRVDAEELMKYLKRHRLNSYMRHIYGFFSDSRSKADEGFIVTTEISDYTDDADDIVISRTNNKFNKLYKQILKKSGLGLSGEYDFHMEYYDVAFVDHSLEDDEM